MATSELEKFWDDAETVIACDRWIDAGLAEDRADRDVTTEWLFDAPSQPAVATVTAVEPGVMCGGPAAVRVFQRQLGEAGPERLRVAHRTPEGSAVSAGELVLQIEGPLDVILAAERTALNIVGHLGGVATQTRAWAERAPGVSILDTRKTLPGLRRFQKFAVRAGGGVNHRSDLADHPLVKENHRDLLRVHLPDPSDRRAEIEEIVRRLRKHDTRLIEIEVEDLESFLACVEFEVDAVLLDNQPPDTIRAWLDEAKARFGRLPRILEASGGITGETVGHFADCGVTRVSLGALTHSVRVWDVSLHVRTNSA